MVRPPVHLSAPRCSSGEWAGPRRAITGVRTPRPTQTMPSVSVCRIESVACVSERNEPALKRYAKRWLRGLLCPGASTRHAVDGPITQVPTLSSRYLSGSYDPSRSIVRAYYPHQHQASASDGLDFWPGRGVTIRLELVR